jgi:ribose-phosphate pyrophosphokinase
VQTFLKDQHGYSVNDALVELGLMADAGGRASANSLTAVMPLFPYARQDRQSRGREPISAAFAIRLLATSGIERILTVDMHSQQTPAAFNGPFDHLTARPLILEKIQEIIAGQQNRTVIVAPDAGRVKESEEYANQLDVDVVMIPKSRRRDNSAEIARSGYVSGVGGQNAIIIDDMIDTAGTLVSAAEVLHNSGAKSIIACATHGLFSNPAIARFKASPIDKVVVTDTVPQSHHQKKLNDKLTVLEIAPLIAEAIGQIATGGSISKMFGDTNHH